MSLKGAFGKALWDWERSGKLLPGPCSSEQCVANTEQQQLLRTAGLRDWRFWLLQMWSQLWASQGQRNQLRTHFKGHGDFPSQSQLPRPAGTSPPVGFTRYNPRPRGANNKTAGWEKEAANLWLSVTCPVGSSMKCKLSPQFLSALQPGGSGMQRLLSPQLLSA